MTGWNDIQLTEFFDAASNNQKANIVKYNARYTVIARINACMLEAAKNMSDVNPVIAGMLFLRAKYAYMAAAGMALSGQVAECFALLRTSLECAGYALLIFDNPSLETIFMSRHLSEADKKIQKDSFTYRRVIDAIKKYDAKLADLFDTFYDRAIDFGAHPNQHAIFSAMTIEQDGDKTHIGQLALHTDEKVIEHALKSTAQVGLAMLLIFQHFFKEKFELLGIRAEIDALKNAGL